MRITDSMSVNNLRYNLSKIGERLSRAQDMLSSGKSVNRPSDDPRKAMTSLHMKSLIEQNRRYQSNVQAGIDWLSTTDQALGSVNEALQRALELGITGSNSVLPEESRQAIAAELEQVLQHLVQVANTEIGGRYVFAGTSTLQQPFEIDQSSLSVSYFGDGGRLVWEISRGASVIVNVAGTELFGSNMEMFSDLVKLRQSVLAGDVQATQQCISRVQEHLDNVLRYRAEVGARINRLQVTLDRLQQVEIEYTRVLSETEDADLAGTMVTLNTEEITYRAALEVGARIAQPSLIDYLR
ncbi:MAG: flagellar hook-associated protein FlgL [Bacillota bacterium]